MNEELAKMTKYGVWEEVDEEAWMSILTGRVHRRSRWVTRGFQRQNVDINKLFAAVVNKDLRYSRISTMRSTR